LLLGLNVVGDRVTHQAVAESLGVAYADPRESLAAK